MKQKLHFGIRIWLFSMMTGAVSLSLVWAKEAVNEAWRPIAERRLNEIYEQGKFRAKGVSADWLGDSTGYIVKERVPDSDRSVFVQYDIASDARTELPSRPEAINGRNPMQSPDDRYVIENRGRRLALRDLKTGERVTITPDVGNRDVWYRKPAWSPDGKQILFVESDETEIPFRNVLVPGDPTYPETAKRRFARVGGKIAVLRLGVVHLDDKTIQWIEVDASGDGFYLGQVEWAGNANEILVEKLSRFRNRREFRLVNLLTEKTEIIFEEQNDAWCVSSQDKNAGLIWTEGGKSFIVISEKDGWRHAWRYSRRGEELSNLTPGEYDIIARAVVDEANGWFYFFASPDNATQRYLHRVPLDGSGNLERITPKSQPGTHEYRFSPDAHWAFHTWSAFDRPPTVELVELPGHTTVRRLEKNSELKAIVEARSGIPTEFLQLQISGGVTMDAWLIKPKDFDASRKYPVFVYIYGEPHAQTVLDEWGTHHAEFHRMIADLGYLVLSIDNRGTPAPKGAAWRRAVFGSLGPLSTAEQAAGLKELGRTRSYVDLDRVGIWGWSGGGSNTLNALFRKPDTYHVGMAVVPKPQPHLYNAWFQEIYMQSRKVNPDGYKRSAPINFAAGLKGKLLIVTGSGETNTHVQIVEGLVDRLIEIGKPFDYMVYPNRDHGLRRGKGTAVHLRMLLTRYLVENLPPGPR
ncbi:MAG: DPP IV N-terminal domain-containing protein [Rubripirellula sp.]|nr:DPP IV N-terminal domain-containing protein [Rubripirellula sp.]